MRTQISVGVLLATLLLAAGAARAQVEYGYDVVVQVADAPPRGSRFVFAVSNGDTIPNNTATIEGLTTDGQLGAAVATTGKTGGEAGSRFWLDQTSVDAVTKWVQEDASVDDQLSFHLRVTKSYPSGNPPGLQPDQFSFAVLEAGSNAGYLTSDDPTTANVLFTVDLRPGSTPTIYHPGAGRPPNAWSVTVNPVPEAGALAGTWAALAALVSMRRRS